MNDKIADDMFNYLTNHDEPDLFLITNDDIKEKLVQFNEKHSEYFTKEEIERLIELNKANQKDYYAASCSKIIKKANHSFKVSFSISDSNLKDMSPKGTLNLKKYCIEIENYSFSQNNKDEFIIFSDKILSVSNDSEKSFTSIKKVTNKINKNSIVDKLVEVDFSSQNKTKNESIMVFTENYNLNKALESYINSCNFKKPFNKEGMDFIQLKYDIALDESIFLEIKNLIDQL